MKYKSFAVLFGLLLVFSALAQPSYDTVFLNGAITITECVGASGLVTVPASLHGFPVVAVGPNQTPFAPVFSPSVNSLIFPEGITTLGNFMCYYDSGLTNVIIPASVTNIEAAAFEYSSLLSVEIPANVAGIGLSAFSSIPTLTNVVIDEGVPSVIGGGAFQLCRSLATVTIPASVVSIGDEAFYGCISLSDVTIAPGVTTIGDLAFFACTNLSTFTIPDTVTSLGNFVFQDCTALTNITIPASVTNLGAGTFTGCSRLRAIQVATNNPFYSSVNGILFNSNQTALIEFPSALGGDYVLPSGVTTIAASAFQGCAHLTGITIANSVTNLGDDAFQQCASLTSITIPGSVDDLGTAVFSDCIGLTNVTLADGLTSTGNFTFIACTNLASVTLPDSITSIGLESFYQCSSLKTLTIPANVTNIQSDAFAYCPNLASVYFTGNAPANDSTVFSADPLVTVSYLANTSGWTSPFGGAPAQPWNPLGSSGLVSFGVQSNQFGFSFNGPANQFVVIEASTNLANPTWIPLQTNTINGPVYFADPQWTNYPGRFYRVVSP